MFVGLDHICPKVRFAVCGCECMIVFANDHYIILIIFCHPHRFYHTLPKPDGSNRMFYGFDPCKLKFRLSVKLLLYVLSPFDTFFEIDDVNGKVKIIYAIRHFSCYNLPPFLLRFYSLSLPTLPNLSVFHILGEKIRAALYNRLYR